MTDWAARFPDLFRPLPPSGAADWLAVWDEIEHAQVVLLAEALGLLRA
jgi:hypothetical protein